MKPFLFVAPGVGAPWTEGRKAFVRDLAAGLIAGEKQVEILSGLSARDAIPSRFTALTAPLRVLRQLKNRLSGDPVDTVVIFPYGRFGRMPGRINSFFLRQALRICETKSVRSTKLFYSCTGLRFEGLAQRFAPALCVGRQGSGMTEITLSIHHGQSVWRPNKAIPSSLLFLCGYQRAKRSELQSVMRERGLRDLLLAGDKIAEAGGKLTIAIPFLRSSEMRSLLTREAMKLCPKLPIAMRDECNPEELLLEHDAFIFPYAQEHAVFVPTSLLEAMSVGVPVIAADQPMYRQLTFNQCGPACSTYRPGDVPGLARTVGDLFSNYRNAVDLATKTRDQIRERWTIERSTQQLLDFAADIASR